MSLQFRFTADEAAEIIAEKGKLPDGFVKDEKREGGYIREELIGWESPEEITGLKSSLQKERKAARENYANMKTAEELNAELKAAADSATATAGDNAGLQEQVTALQEQLGTLTGTLQKERVARTIAEVSAANKGSAALHDHLALRVKADVTNGNPIVVDPDTQQTVLGTDGKPLTPAEYTQHIRTLADTKDGVDKYGAFFVGTQSSGGATPPGGGRVNGGGSVVPANARRSMMTPREKVEAIRDLGDAGFQALPF